MRQFKSFDAIRDAQVEELLEVPGMNRRAAESVYQFFRKPGQEAQTEAKNEIT